jgi:uncharacterized protein (TIGR03437 family)
MHPRASADNDEGPVDANLEVPYVTLVLKRSDAQEADLEKFLAEQQDPSSPNYHHWLTPEEYADRFGVSQGDIDKLTVWLKDQNLTVKSVARGRGWVAVGGRADAVQRAFGANLHRYRVDGESDFANTTDPTIPEAFSPIVSAIRGLNNIRLKPRPMSRAIPRSESNPLDPRYNARSGAHYLAPDDLAAIYNIKPLLNAGIDGSGQKLVVVGQTQIDLADIQQFRTFFNLPPNDPQVVLVPGSRNPGTRSGDLGEADLDLEWAGAVARNATIIYVYAYDVMTAAQYAIDQNIAPVMSISYGSCEAQNSRSEALALQSWARQANAQGMTWFAASGDSGGLDCVGGSSSRYASTLAVDIPAAIPEITGVGGTRFNEGSGSYWSATADANRASALGYIPEVAWNDSDGSDLSSTGGGASTFFAKPSWQTGMGVPNNTARNVPDVALSASAAHVGYIVFSEGTQQAYGGTSAGAPSFAGIATLLNHYLVANRLQATGGVGNMNPRLYTMAQTTPSAFHDIISGDNIVTANCTARSINCTPGSYGFQAGGGYDQVTGLGSVDAHQLVTAWTDRGATPSTVTASISLSSTANTLSAGSTAVLTATVSGSTGSTPTGTVTFSAGASQLGSANLSGAGGSATASLTINASQLQVGNNSVRAQYSGDGVFPAAATTMSLTVQSGVTGPPSIRGVANGASFASSFAPGMVVSVFGSNLAEGTKTASSVPLPAQMQGASVTVNGYTAPVYYVSPTQLNVQIPYEVAAFSTATLRVTVNGQRVSTSIPVSAAAPGIFVNSNGAPVPHTTGTRGSVVTLFVTGAGAVSPLINTGAAPASGTATFALPQAQQSVRVSVGGVTAPVQFAGITPGLVGVMQINYQIPTSIATGNRSVVVTIGGIPSAAATLTVQ